MKRKFMMNWKENLEGEIKKSNNSGAMRFLRSQTLLSHFSYSYILCDSFRIFLIIQERMY